LASYLFDNNVWIDLVDADAVNQVRLAARDHGHEILVSPSIVYEMLRYKNDARRKRQVEAVTRRAWRRLPPEAYRECHEVLEAVRTHRPEWLHPAPPRLMLENYQINQRDWYASKGGFWDRARAETTRLAGWLSEVEATVGARAYEQARARRQAFHAAGVTSLEQVDLTTPEITAVTPITRFPGQRGERVEWWRASGGGLFEQYFLRRPGDPTIHDWLDPFIDERRIHPRSWWRFWLYDVAVPEMPLAWLRGAFEFVQSAQKVNKGTPADNQLGTYLPLADRFVTADTDFAAAIEKVRGGTPVPLAKVVVVPGGVAGASFLLNSLQSQAMPV
jgi:hypothetical protein